MAWESRGNRLYYYRKKRQGNRVISEYVGTGSSAMLLAQSDGLRREESLRIQAKWQAQKSEFREMEADLDHLNEIVCVLVRATLLASGYHPHKGQWRKNRDV
jgi:hypothetical protein